MTAAAGISPALSIVGEFTIFTAQDCKAQLLALIASIPEGDGGEVDLSGVTEIDSAGLQLMLMAKREATILEREVRFVRHSDPVLELIDLCALAGQFGDPLLIRSSV